MKKKNIMRGIICGISAASLMLAACGKQADSGASTSQAAAEERADDNAGNGAGDADGAGETDANGTGADESEAASVDASEIEALKDVERPESLGEIKLGKYEGIELTTEEAAKATEADVDAYLESYILPNYLESTEDAARLGDTVNIDYVGKKDGVAFDGGTAEGQDLTLGSGRFIDGFEDGLVGHKKGEKLQLDLTFPENYGNEELNGAAVTFDVTINEVKRIPELSDGLAAEIDPSVTTAAEYRNKILTQLQENADYAAEQHLSYLAMDAVVKDSEVKPTEEAVDWQIAEMITGYFEPMMLQSTGLGLADMLNMQGLSLDAFKEQLKESAEESVCQIMVMDEIAKEQNISASEEQIKAWAEKNGTTVEALQETATDEEIKTTVTEQLAIEYVIEKAKITYTPAESDASSAAAE